MKLSKVSEDKFYESTDRWEVDTEYAEPMFNYLVYGFSPGGFFTCVLANDFINAMARSHPANTIPALKKLAGWIYNEAPREAWGNYELVNRWLEMDSSQRRKILERSNLIFSPRDETWETLKS